MNMEIVLICGTIDEKMHVNKGNNKYFLNKFGLREEIKMPLNLASPGILVREVDLTTGRVDPTTDKIGGIVGPFSQGPVAEPTLIANENELLNTFGQPYDVDKHYET